MGTFCIDWMFSFTDSNVKTNLEGRCTNRNYLCIFKCIRINWSSINVTGISGTMITMPDIAYVLIFRDNDLTNITEDHFEMKLIARLLDQIYVVQPPMFPPRYDDALPQEYEYSQPHTSTDGARPSAPQFPEHLHLLLTCS